MAAACWSNLCAALLALAAGAQTPAARANYERSRKDLADARSRLAEQWKLASPDERPVVLAKAREELLSRIDRDIFPAWFGTPWDFYGTSQVPGQGQIACGYFVTTVFDHAGFRVQRVLLAQQRAEWIARTLAREADVRRFRSVGGADVAGEVRRWRGDGLYVVGLDNHVGFLRVAGERVDFCHSSYLGERAVLCEGAAQSPAFDSSYYVVGALFTDEQLADWLQQRPLPTVRR